MAAPWMAISSPVASPWVAEVAATEAPLSWEAKAVMSFGAMPSATVAAFSAAAEMASPISSPARKRS